MDDIQKKAMDMVLGRMGDAAKKAKASKYAKKPKAEVEVEVEGGPTLSGLMSKHGNSGAEIAAESDISPEELEAILAGAK